jgi:hypothetical protein
MSLAYWARSQQLTVAEMTGFSPEMRGGSPPSSETAEATCSRSPWPPPGGSRLGL